MAKDEGRNMALVLLGIVAIIAVVGLVLLYTGTKTGEAYAGSGVYDRGQYYPSPADACRRVVDCQNGAGGNFLMVDPNDDSVAICDCSEHHREETVFDWTYLDKEQPLYIPTQHYWKVQWKPQTSRFLDQNGRRISPVYEEPGTYPSGYYGDSRIS